MISNRDRDNETRRAARPRELLRQFGLAVAYVLGVVVLAAIIVASGAAVVLVLGGGGW